MIGVLVVHYARPSAVNTKDLVDFAIQNIVMIVVYVKKKNDIILCYITFY